MRDYVKFIDYESGMYNHCSGTLTVKINNKIVSFGDYYKAKQVADESYPHNTFWCMNCHFNSDWEFKSAEWEFNIEDVPFKYRKYFDQLTKVLKDNVFCGCTGCS